MELGVKHKFCLAIKPWLDLFSTFHGRGTVGGNLQMPGLTSKLWSCFCSMMKEWFIAESESGEYAMFWFYQILICKTLT